MRVVRRHAGGGNILHFDGHVTLAKQPAHLRIDHWDPDYKLWNPGW
ncbi:MAG: hypothetical protein FJ291_29380 [Planctomycetes bacterium]|nr:hypothetical protein [Planctomycetota bacterium]